MYPILELLKMFPQSYYEGDLLWRIAHIRNNINHKFYIYFHQDENKIKYIKSQEMYRYIRNQLVSILMLMKGFCCLLSGVLCGNRVNVGSMNNNLWSQRMDWNRKDNSWFSGSVCKSQE